MRSSAFVLVALVAVIGVKAQTPQTQSPPSFAVRTTLVPVDIRVVDRQGNPVTDLTRADFDVLEDGKRRTIEVFAPSALVPNASAVGDELRMANGNAVSEPQRRRVFLLVMGRGRLEVVSHGLTAAEDFVRDRLLPQDQVGIMAWDRAVAFSSNHDTALAFLKRYRLGHERIERELSDWFSGLRGAYGSKEIPASIQTHIDEVFGSASALMTTAAGGPNRLRTENDHRDVVEALQTRAQVQGLPSSSRSGGPATVGLTAAQESALKSGDLRTASFGAGSLTLDDFTELMTRSDQDLSRLYAAIEYLRPIEGEKHLLFITPGGVALPRVEDDKDLAGRAGDARVVIDCIQTGGITADDMPFDDPFDSPSAWAFPTLERFAQMTGGTWSIASYASKGFDAIDRATRFDT